MRKFLRLALILACVASITAAITAVTVVTAQKRDEVPQPLPETPRAIAKLCTGGGVVHWSEAQTRDQMMRAYGCERVEFLPLDNEYVLAYGVRFVFGE